MAQKIDFLKSESNENSRINGQKKATELRRAVQHFYFKKGLSKDEIAAVLGVSKGFVVNWTQDPDRDPTVDHRGWPKGKHRKYDPLVVDRVRQLHQELVNDPKEVFTSATVIELRWREQYPDEEIPSLRQIGRIMKTEGLSKPRRGRQKGVLRRLCYPEGALDQLTGGRPLECDFVGQKFLRGGEGPLNFVGYSFKEEPRLRWYYQVEAQNTDAVLSTSADFFERFEIPNAIKVDNAAAMHGTTHGKRCLSRFHHAMLSQQIIPIHSVPRRPATQASIEGNNSVFSRFFWNKHEFEDQAQVSEHLTYFNQSSLRYLRYRPPSRPRSVPSSWSPVIYFLRQVREERQTKRARIKVTNESIELSPKLITYFVLAQWQLEQGKLNILFEKEQGVETIASIPFKINKNSSYRI